MASRQNSELDSQDIKNWLQYNRSTTVGPQLSLVDTYFSNEDLRNATQPVAIASLYDDPDAPTPNDVVPEYQCIGYPRHKDPTYKVIHFAITLDGVQVISRECQKTIDELETKRQSRVQHNSIVGKDDHLTDDCLVL